MSVNPIIFFILQLEAAIRGLSPTYLANVTVRSTDSYVDGASIGFFLIDIMYSSDVGVQNLTSEMERAIKGIPSFLVHAVGIQEINGRLILFTNMFAVYKLANI